MSGIIGIVHKDAPVEAQMLESLTRGMAWRGPDAQRCWCAPGVGFGHALLRTTWESAREAQPLGWQDRFWITADARIDAREELTDKLRSKFSHASNEMPDAELLLLAYASWGDECLDHLIGDFAFGIWDAEKKRLFCARDHFGVTPFYYFHRGNTLVFSNTLRCMLAYPGVSRELNELPIADYLLTGCNQNHGTTWFRDIQTLPAAHTLSFESNSLQMKRYWDVPQITEDLRYSQPEEYVEHFNHLFERAVLDRLRMDDVASSMSGGLDSSSITVVAHQAYRQNASRAKITAYSIGFDWLLPDDERYYAALIAEKNDIPIRYLSAESYMIVDDFERAWRKTPEPRFISRPAPAREIGEIAVASGIRVGLGGLGGDPLLERGAFHWRKRIEERRFGDLAKETRYFRATYGSYPPLGIRTRLFGAWYKWRYRGVASSLRSFQQFDADFVQRVNLGERIRVLSEMMSTTDPRVGMADFSFWAQALSSGDPDISGLPLKVRHPFFDVRLLEYVTKIPPVPWLLDKNLLRAAMRDLLPEKVRLRAKTPLRTSFYYELATRGYEPWVPELLATPGLERYVNVNHLRSLLESPGTLSQAACNGLVYHSLSLASWLKQETSQ